MKKTPGVSEDTPVYTLRVASQLANLPAHSIRQYVDKGLIVPFKLESTRHLYSQSDINRLRNIHILIHDKGMNFAGIKAMMAMVPCWAALNCAIKDRKQCMAFSESYTPCWESSEKDRICRNENCRECSVYKKLSQDIDFKSVLKSLV